jgi:phosphatidylglycerol---prolipoprotein diacylglyceryl transferase
MMDPIAFNLGNISISWYGVMFGLGLLLCFILWRKLGIEKGMDKITILELYLVTIVSIFIGCRVFYVVFYDLGYFLSNPLDIFFIWQGGLSSHGGLIFGTLGFYCYCRKKGLDFWKWADIAIIPMALVTGFIRIGNFLNGELVGRITSVSWGVDFGDGFLRHPSQLYEAVKNFFIFGVLFSCRNLSMPRGSFYCSFIFMFSFLRFFTEFFKEYLVFSSGLTIGQWISLVLSIISGVILYLLFTKKLVLGKVN